MKNPLPADLPIMPRTIAAPSIHRSTTLGPITLRVAELARSVHFYEKAIGLTRVNGNAGSASLGIENELPFILLKETPGARHVPHASGLYHFAILVPTRADLGDVLQRLLDADIRFGQADHLVSEALYLSDPDGNGIEIYRDRPRSEWSWRGGRVEMAVDPLDLDSLLGEARKGQQTAMPAGTRIGHIHLQVSDVQKAVEFYHGVLGFDITASFQGAAFLSAGGYHHHIGLNSWSSRGAPPSPPDSAGLESFTLQVPSMEERERIAGRLTAAGIPSVVDERRVFVRDLSNVGIEIFSA